MGITMEVQDICKEMYLPAATQVYVSREKAKEAIELHNHISVKREMEGKFTCDQSYNRDLKKMQAFMTDKSLEKSIIKVMWLTNMINNRTTMQGKYKQYSCAHCSEGLNEKVLEIAKHLMQCPAHKEFRLQPSLKKYRFLYSFKL